MANETRMTMVGNIVRDPELRFTKDNVPVLTLSIASTEKRFDRNTNQLVDGDPIFMEITVWRDMAVNANSSFVKGQQIIVVGDLKQSNWETEDGRKGTKYSIHAEHIGPSVRFGQATFVKTPAQQGGFNNGPQPQWSNQQGQGEQWAPSQPTLGSDEPPF